MLSGPLQSIHAPNWLQIHRSNRSAAYSRHLSLNCFVILW